MPFKAHVLHGAVAAAAEAVSDRFRLVPRAAAATGAVWVRVFRWVEPVSFRFCPILVPSDLLSNPNQLPGGVCRQRDQRRGHWVRQNQSTPSGSPGKWACSGMAASCSRVFISFVNIMLAVYLACNAASIIGVMCLTTWCLVRRRPTRLEHLPHLGRTLGS